MYSAFIFSQDNLPARIPHSLFRSGCMLEVEKRDLMVCLGLIYGYFLRKSTHVIPKLISRHYLQMI